MDYEIKIGVSPEVDMDKLNNIIKAIDEKFISLKKIEPFDAKAIEESLNSIAKYNTNTVLASDITRDLPYLGYNEQYLRAKYEEDLYYNDQALEKKLINEEQFLQKQIELKKKYIDDYNKYLESSDKANYPNIQPEKGVPDDARAPSPYFIPQSALDKIEADIERMWPEIEKELARDAEVEKFNENSLQYAKALHDLNLERAKEALKAGEINDDDFKEISDEIKHDYALAKVRNKFYLKEEEINADEGLTPIEASKALYDNAVEEAKAYLKSKLIDKDEYNQSLEDIKQEWKDRDDDILHPKSLIPLQFDRDDKNKNYKLDFEKHTSDYTPNKSPFAMDMTDMDIEPATTASVTEILSTIANLKQSLANTIAERNELINLLNVNFSEGKISPKSYEKKLGIIEGDFSPAINNLNLRIEKENNNLASALSQNDEVQKKIGEIEEIYNDRIDTVLAGAEDENSFETLKAIADIEFQKQLEFYRAKLITPEQYNTAVKSIRAKLNEDRLKSEPMKMDMREFDIEEPETLYKGKPFTDQISHVSKLYEEVLPSDDDIDELMELNAEMNELSEETKSRLDKFDLEKEEAIDYDGPNDWNKTNGEDYDEDAVPWIDPYKVAPPNTLHGFKEKNKSENMFGFKDVLDVYEKTLDLALELPDSGHLQLTVEEMTFLENTVEKTAKKFKVNSPSYAVMDDIFGWLQDKYDDNEDAVWDTEEMTDEEEAKLPENYKAIYTKEFRADFEEAIKTYIRDFIPKYNEAMADKEKPIGDETKLGLELPDSAEFVSDFFYDPLKSKPDEDTSYGEWLKTFNNGNLIEWLKDRFKWRKDGGQTNSSEYPKTGNIVGYENLGEGFEDVGVLAAISENWDTASNTLSDEQSLLNYFAAIKKVNESPEMAMIRENWDTGSNTPGEEEAYLQYIGFEKERNTNRAGSQNNGGSNIPVPPKMMTISDLEMEAIYAEFEGDNEKYRDDELAANQKLLDDKLIAEEQFLENKLKINQDFETRKKEVAEYIETVDAISTSDTSKSSDSTDTTSSDPEPEVTATKKPAKVFDAMHELITDRSHALRTATTNLTKSIGETLGGLFEGNEDKLKEGSKKMLKTLADLIKKVASAAITNIIIGQLGITGATTGIGAIFGAPAILALVQGVVSAIIDPIVNGLTMHTGGRADVPTGVVIGDNPYSPEWVLRDFDIQAIIDTALQKAFRTPVSGMDKSTELQNELIQTLKTQEKYAQADNFFNTGEALSLNNPNSQSKFQNAMNIDNSQIIKNLEQLNEQFSNFEGRIHVVESEIAQATNNFNNRINRRSYI